MPTASINFVPVQPGLEVSRVARSSHVFPRHFHDDIYAIGLMHEGASSGFTDQSHFGNTFKHYTGATPGQYALQP